MKSTRVGTHIRLSLLVAATAVVTFASGIVVAAQETPPGLLNRSRCEPWLPAVTQWTTTAYSSTSDCCGIATSLRRSCTTPWRAELPAIRTGRLVAADASTASSLQRSTGNRRRSCANWRCITNDWPKGLLPPYQPAQPGSKEEPAHLTRPRKNLMRWPHRRAPGRITWRSRSICACWPGSTPAMPTST